MSTQTECDICGGRLVGLGYTVLRQRRADRVHICSFTCLASLATGEAWEEAEELARVTPRPRKRWWQR